MVLVLQAIPSYRIGMPQKKADEANASGKGSLDSEQANVVVSKEAAVNEETLVSIH